MLDVPFDIQSLHKAYAEGLTPAQMIDTCLRRIEAAADPGIFIALLDRDTLLAEAARLGPFDPKTKPLWGIPFAIKDNIDLTGMPTTAGSPSYAFDPERDAFVVALLRKAGAIAIGKTNLDQFATGLVGVRTPYPVPTNTLDPEIVPGGSSSGSAVAVARGIVSFALGTDTAGSGRVPAALNNIVGLKPTLGALSASGMLPACRTLDTISIFALTVEDAYWVFSSAAAFDTDDAYSRPVPTTPLGAPPPHLRVGIPDAASLEFFGDDLQAEAYTAALEMVEAAGGTLVEIDLTPFYRVADMLYEGVWVAERHTVLQELLETDPAAVDPVVAGIVGKATAFSATDTFRSFYRLKELEREVGDRMRGLDLLCVPSIPTFYSVADLKTDPVGPNRRLGTYTNFVNLLDMCGIAVPTAPRSDGRPGSVTLLGRAGADGLIAGLAAELHSAANVPLGATDWPTPIQISKPSQAQAGEIAIAAVGAHMSGLPLNGELTRLGGRFLRTAVTAAGYRLFKLAGGPPFRPGLVRDPDGGAFDLEIWALPSAAFGAFMRGIPAPLGIGTVALEDGSTVNGFICEAAGLTGAIDITEFGGWRAFLASQTPRDTAKP